MYITINKYICKLQVKLYWAFILTAPTGSRVFRRVYVVTVVRRWMRERQRRWSAGCRQDRLHSGLCFLSARRLTVHGCAPLYTRSTTLWDDCNERGIKTDSFKTKQKGKTRRRIGATSQKNQPQGDSLRSARRTNPGR
ncbi:hypothetical protein PAMP_015721 [Pampus punctatissimus]